MGSMPAITKASMSCSGKKMNSREGDDRKRKKKEKKRKGKREKI